MRCTVCDLESDLINTRIGSVCRNCKSYLIKQGLLTFHIPRTKKEKRAKKNRSIREKLWELDQTCGICGYEIIRFSKSSIDHKIPLSKGGPRRDTRNIQLAHKICNNLKADRVFLEHYYLFWVFRSHFFKFWLRNLKQRKKWIGQYE